MGTVEECLAYKNRMESPHLVISDPNKLLYSQFGLRKGSLSAILHPKAFTGSARAASKGFFPKLPVGDPWMLAGTFVISEQGDIVFERHSHTISDYVSGSEIVELLNA
jgi:hypothetical protein